MTSVHLTAAVLGWLQDNSGQLITGLWRAVTSLTDAGNFSVAAAVLKSLFPEGGVSCDDITATSLHHHTNSSVVFDQALTSANNRKLLVMPTSRPSTVCRPSSFTIVCMSAGGRVQDRLM